LRLFSYLVEARNVARLEPLRGPQPSPTERASRRVPMHTGIFGRWDGPHIGRSEDQPLIFAVLIVLIAITLYLFL